MQEKRDRVNLVGNKSSVVLCIEYKVEQNTFICITSFVTNLVINVMLIFRYSN